MVKRDCYISKVEIEDHLNHLVLCDIDKALQHMRLGISLKNIIDRISRSVVRGGKARRSTSSTLVKYIINRVRFKVINDGMVKLNRQITKYLKSNL